MCSCTSSTGRRRSIFGRSCTVMREVLRAVPEWEIRLLMPSHFTTALDLFEEAASEEMRRPLRLSRAEEIGW